MKIRPRTDNGHRKLGKKLSKLCWVIRRTDRTDRRTRWPDERDRRTRRWERPERDRIKEPAQLGPQGNGTRETRRVGKDTDRARFSNRSQLGPGGTGPVKQIGLAKKHRGTPETRGTRGFLQKREPGAPGEPGTREPWARGGPKHRAAGGRTLKRRRIQDPRACGSRGQRLHTSTSQRRQD